MPTEKRRRQDEGRMSRLETERAAAKRQQRVRGARTLGAILLALLVGSAIFAFVTRDDGDDDTVSGDATTTVPADETDSTAAATGPGDPAIGDTECPPAEGTAERVGEFASGPKACIDPAKAYTATIETTKGTIVVELAASEAPKTVNSFVFLARNRFYEGVGFHRIIPGFVVQGGDPTGEGSGGPGYEFADELPTGEAPYYSVGSLAMANSGANTNGSQFFIVAGDQGVNLPADYSRFGMVTEGLDVVQAIEATGSAEGAPTEETTITSVTVTES
ncbi:MAG: peptidylprolyl isomerase [Acidimicrobiales bacterium]|nr:peptidylprolyl isomerase [Acidimicrobiales bacterium]